MSSNYPHIPKDGASFTRDGIAAHLTAAEAEPCTDRTDALARLDVAVHRFTAYATDAVAAGRWSLAAEGDTVRALLAELRACRAALED